MDSAGLTRAEQAAAAIRQSIASGEYVSGERVVELTLSKRLHVSQITIREALWILEQEGWVIKRARHGCTVRDFDAQSANEVFLVYEALIDLIFAEVVGRNGRKPSLRAMRGCVQTARRALLAGDRSGAIAALFDSHVAFAQTANLPLTEQLLTRVINQARLLEAIRQTRAPVNLADLTRYVDSHDALIDMFESNGVGARDLLRDILEQYRRGVEQIFNFG